MRKGKGGSVSIWQVTFILSIFLRDSLLQVSAGEEGIAVGSASALTPDDVVFAQYRETGVFKQRGFQLDDFMNQLFANRKDSGKGRNMPVHYGNQKLNHVGSYYGAFVRKS